MNAIRSARPSRLSRWKPGVIATCVILYAIGLASSAGAAEASNRGEESARESRAAELEELRRTIEAQNRALQQQIQTLEERSRALAEQQSKLEAQQLRLELLRSRAASPFDLATLSGMGPAPSEGAHAATNGVTAEVGRAPKPESTVEIATLADRGGVLTPEGVLTIEPELEFTSSAIRRFDFQGIEVANAVLVGEIDAFESDRDGYTTTLNARYGLTNRLEASLKVPYVRRRDRMTNRVVSQDQLQGSTRSSGGSGLGDVELGLHYQFRRTSSRMPIVIGNLRIKSDTGTSPFDVDRNAAGVETELPTGTGTWALEPSLTFILPTDPAVLYGSLSYAYNFEKDVDEVVNGASGPVRVGHVDPGDSVGFGFGLGLGLNEKVSLNLGYSHQYLMPTSTELEGLELETNPLHVGELQLGLSYQLSTRSTLQLTLAIGVTEAAPDLRFGVRVPVSWRLLE